MAFISNVLVLVMISAVPALTVAHTFYNSTTQICCNGNVFAKLGSMATTSCCGSKAYDYVNSLCCNNQIVKLPQTTDRNSYSCCQGKSMRKQKVYNYRTQQCCNGKVFDVQPGGSLTCCGRTLVNINSNYTCCGGRLLPNSADVSCCFGQKFYNYKRQTCCPIYEYKNNNYGDLLAVEVKKRTSNSTSCCGNGVYDNTKDACCDGIIAHMPEPISRISAVQCCNGVPYDMYKKVCCQRRNNNGVIVESAIHDQFMYYSCCGASIYNWRDSMCCGDTITPKPDGVDRLSFIDCCGGQIITNSTTQICFNNKLFERKDSNYYVCGEQVFDTRTHRCCGDTVIANTSSLECCNGKAYDKATQKCCFNEVEQMSDEDREANNDACCAVEN